MAMSKAMPMLLKRLVMCCGISLIRYTQTQSFQTNSLRISVKQWKEVNMTRIQYIKPFTMMRAEL